MALEMNKAFRPSVEPLEQRVLISIDIHHWIIFQLTVNDKKKKLLDKLTNLVVISVKLKKDIFSRL